MARHDGSSERERARAAEGFPPKVPGEPLPAHVLRKFKEKNDKAAFDAKVMRIVDEANEILEKNSELRNWRYESVSTEMGKEVKRRFEKAGWKVEVSYSDAPISCSFTITLD